MSLNSLLEKIFALAPEAEDLAEFEFALITALSGITRLSNLNQPPVVNNHIALITHSLANSTVGLSAALLSYPLLRPLLIESVASRLVPASNEDALLDPTTVATELLDNIFTSFRGPIQ